MPKCEQCGFLRSEGYEYPEYYCGAGVAEDDKMATDDGCRYHYKTLKKREKIIDEAWEKAQEIKESDLKYFFGEEEP